MKRIYHKLIRDRIPEIIETQGQCCIVKQLSDEEYLKMVDAKLDEELAEYHKEQNLEELADLMEVIYAARKLGGSPENSWSGFVRRKKPSGVLSIRDCFCWKFGIPEICACRS
jgi:predicted house-cleaning noncanonical NTP pyrophosphatase (MazG superfamily)